MSLLTWALLLGLASLGVPARCAGQDAKKTMPDGGYEKFDAVDPITQGKSELLAALGCLRIAPFVWRAPMGTAQLQELLGGMDTLFVETDHFFIASTLATYVVPNDRAERERLEEERRRIEERVGRLKLSKKEVAPWLRLHLYAQRLESIYARFVADFGLAQVALAAGEVYPGQKSKFRVLVCERRSEWQRYLGAEFGVESSEYYWGMYPDGSLFFGGNLEGPRQRWTHISDTPLDAQLHAFVLSGAVAALVGGYRDCQYGAPPWFQYGLMHHYAREVDPRWVPACGQKETKEWEAADSEWYRRVHDLVEVAYFDSVAEMFSWVDYSELDERDHLIAWSRVEYLLTLEGDRRGFLDGVCRKAPATSGEERRAAYAERSREALRAGFGLEPADFERGWLEHVKKSYKKRK